MADIAELGFKANTSELKDAKASLEALSPAAATAEKSSQKLSATLAKVDNTADKLAAAANGLVSAVTKMNAVLDRNAGSATTAAAAQGTLATASNRVAVTFSGIAAAGQSAAGATMGLATAAGDAATALDRQATAAGHADTQMEQLDAHVAAYRANLRQLKIDQMAAGVGTQQLDAHMMAYRNHLDSVGAGAKKAGQAIKFTAQDSLNASRQMADIGVTAAMGMSPFMIAIQQGPQLLDILQNKAAETGQSLGAVFRAAGVAIWTALAPILPFIAGIALVVGTVAAAFGLAARQITKDNGDVTKSLDLSKSQAEKLKDHLDRLKDNKIDVHVTGMDALKGFFQTAGEGFDTSGATKSWNDLLDSMTKYGEAFLKGFYGSIQGANDAIVATWQDLPAAFGDVFIQALNYAIDGYDAIVQAGWNFLGTLGNLIMNIPQYAVDAFNGVVNAAGAGMSMTVDIGFKALGQMLSAWRTWPAAIGQFFWDGAKKAFDGVVWLYNQTVSLIKKVMTGDFGHVSNPFAGSAAKVATDGAKAFTKGYDDAGKKIDEFGAKWSANSRKIAQQRIMTQVGPHGADPKTPKGGKTDAEKFEDIVKGANNDISAQKAKAAAAAIDMTAEAAATLEEKTKLLNEAQSKGIKLTDGMRSKIDQLASAYGAAKVAADNAVGLRDVLKTSDADIAGIKSQADMIGLYGRQLAYATEMAKLLAEAKQKNMTADAIAAARPQFEAKANQFADASASLSSSQFMEDQRRAAKERMMTLQQEQAQLGMSVDETNRLRIENELLASARQKNIDLSPADIAALQGIAAAQAATESSIRKTKEALDFAKDAARGFIGDMIEGAQKGQSVWKTFGDSVLNVLDKVLNKLIDVALEAAFTGSGGGGGFFDNLIKVFTGSVGGASNGTATTHAGAGNVKFAKGAAFSNGIVNSPTLFRFAKGAALGQMGEAGPEAVMPLQRGPDGSLGVQMYGGRGRGAPNNNVQIEQHFHIDGAVSSQDVQNMVRQGANEAAAHAVTTVRRSLAGWSQQLQQDGAIV